jgi:cytochrome c-type biogenesis protein CcmF
MLIPVGQLALYLAALLGAMALLLGLLGAARRDAMAARLARQATVAAAVAVAVAAAALLVALVRCDLRLDYAARYSASWQPTIYRLSALWAGEAGSLLTWTVLALTAAAVFVVSRPITRDAAAAGALAVLTPLLLTILLIVGSSPFVAADLIQPDGAGMNLQLQTWSMIVHPPLLLAGYAVLTVPFGIALANLISGRLDAGLESLRRFLLVGWSLLTAGIAFGAYWAYVELGWGGYWAWDPVENASLVPWLLVTAALHTLSPARRTGRLLRTTLALVVASLVACVLATYITRGGVEAGVHAYARGAVTDAYLAFALAVLFLAAALLVLRRPRAAAGTADTAPAPSHAGRSVWLMAAVAALLAAFAVAVFLGTLGPQVLSQLAARRYQMGVPQWNVLGAVFGLLLLAVLLVGSWVAGGLAWKGRRTTAVAHAAYILLVAAVAGSHLVRDNLTAVVAEGQTVRFAGHGFACRNIILADDPDRGTATLRVELAVSRGQRLVATLRPAHIADRRNESRRADVDLMTGPLQDLYVSLNAYDPQQRTVSLSLHRTGLVVWIWVASGMMTLAGLAAAVRRPTATQKGGPQP